MTTHLKHRISSPFLRFSPLAKLASCLLWLGLTNLSTAQEQLLRNVYHAPSNTWVEVSCLLGKLPSYGYAPIRVTVKNGTDRDLKLRLDFSSSPDQYSYSLGNNNTSSHFSLVGRSGETNSYDLIVPVNTNTQTSRYNNGSNLDLTLLASGFDIVKGSMFSENSADWPAVLMSSELYVPNSSTLDSHINKSSSSSSKDLTFAGAFDPKKLPEDWRAYQGQDVIMMTSEDWRSVSPGARLAILEWNRLGGKIILYTENTSEDLATLHIDKSLAGQRKTTRSLGQVRLIKLPTASRLQAAKTEKLIKDRNLYKSSHSSILNSYARSWPLQDLLGEKHFNIALFTIILFAFGILVGPINLFVFAKSGQRHKLFITTPIISVAASVLLIITILIQDGFGGKGHRIAIVDVQPHENKAYITQEQTARTGVLLGNTFETSEPTMITPIALASSRWTRVLKDGKANSTYEANHGKQGIRLSGDWFQSRSVHGHLLHTIRPTRAKLELTGTEASPALSSTFEFDLGTVYYQDESAQWWVADSLKKGASLTLRKSNQGEFTTWLNKQKKNFSKINADKLERLSASQKRFYTFTDQFKVTETSQAINWLTTKALITGQL